MCDKGQVTTISVLSLADYLPPTYHTGSSRNYGLTTTASVDMCLAEIISNLNVSGIATITCCCGHNSPSREGNPYIAFYAMPSDLENIYVKLKEYLPQFAKLILCFEVWHMPKEHNYWPDLSDGRINFVARWVSKRKFKSQSLYRRYLPLVSGSIYTKPPRDGRNAQALIFENELDHFNLRK